MTNTLSEPVSSNLIHRITLAEGFTQSEISDMSCMQRWNYRYNQRMGRPDSFNFALEVGTLFHAVMEQFYATKGKRWAVATLQFPENHIASMEDHIKRDYWNAVLPRMCEAYAIYYKDDHEKLDIHRIEEEVSIEYKGFTLRGKIDLEFTCAGEWIMDHKTTARITKNIVAAWDFRFQFMFYVWLKWKAAQENLRLNGIYVNAIKKPELRIKKNESLPEFAQRVFEDMVQEPEKYFYREKLPLTKGALERFEQLTVNPKLAILQFLVDNPEHPAAQAMLINKNTDECQKYGGAPCTFLDMCKHGETMRFQYEVREQKHNELSSETNEE